MGRGVKSRRFARRSLGEGRAVPLPAGEDGVEIVSVGRSLRGFSVEIRPVGSSGPSEEGCIGRIWVAGPSLMEGYIDREASPIQDGWLDTGDEGFLLDGELFVTGRAKDVIVIRGQNHCPHEIEAVLDDVDGVRKGCAVAVGSVEDEGEVLLVFVEVKEDAGEIAEACRRAILAATGLNPALVVLLAPGTMPRTSSGKLRRQETLKRWKRGTLLPAVPVTPWRMAGVMAKSFWATRKGGN